MGFTIRVSQMPQPFELQQGLHAIFVEILSVEHHPEEVTQTQCRRQGRCRCGVSVQNKNTLYQCLNVNLMFALHLPIFQLYHGSL